MESELFFHAVSWPTLEEMSWQRRLSSAVSSTAGQAQAHAQAHAQEMAQALAQAQAQMQATHTQQQSEKWKSALWTKDTTEPAMLRVPIVLILFLFLWAANIWIFEKLRIQYYSALSIKSNPLAFTFVTSCILAAAYAAIITLFSNALGLAVESGVLIFYAIILLAQMLPATLPGQETKTSFYRLLRTVFFPGTTISFPEVLLADALCSLSKVLKDFGVTVIAVYASFTATAATDLHEHGMLLCAVLASLPFWLRVRQCWVQLDSAHDNIAKLPIALNIVKYLTGFPPIWLAAAASLGFFHPSLPTVLALVATVNSVYSYLWDVIMDWGLLTFTREGRVHGRSRLMYPAYVYVLACLMNLVIRFSWAANRIPSLAALHTSHLVLMVETAEVLRRAVWNLFRIEWEIIVQADKHARGVDSRDNLLGIGTPLEDKPSI